MSKEQDNKAIVGRWFTEFWGNPWNPKVIEELAAADMLLQYSLHAPRRGHQDVREFMTGFRTAFPDLAFGGAGDLGPVRLLGCRPADRLAAGGAPPVRAAALPGRPRLSAGD